MYRWLHRVQFRLRTIARRRVLESDLDDELRFHLEMQTAANVRLGMTPSIASATARREFGRIEAHKEEYRDHWGARLLEAFVEDVRTGLRQLILHPAISIAIVIAMALGIGANTAVFSVFNAVILNPPPYAEADRLIRLRASIPQAKVTDALFSAPEIRDLRSRASTLSDVAEFHYMYFILLGQGEAQRVSAGVVSSNFFSVIGVKPLIGRGFLPDEEKAGAPGVIVLSNRYWQARFGGDYHAVGKQVEMNDRMHTIVGVLPPLPNFPNEADIYLPTSACPLRISPEADKSRSMRLVSALARVGSGVSDLNHVSRELSTVAAQLRTTYPESYPTTSGFDLSAIAVNDDLTRRFKPTLLALIAAATFLLLILSASVGALLLARTVSRRSELAMRTALGAWKGRLFRQFFTEALVLTVFGATLGLVIGYLSLPTLVTFVGQFTSRASEIHLDQTALLFTLGISVFTALLFGSLITLAANFEGRGLISPNKMGGARLRPMFKALVVIQIAVSFGLLSTAGLMLRTLNHLTRVETGLAADVVTMRLSLDFVKYWSSEQRSDYFQRVLDALATTSGVEYAALAGTVPYVGDSLAGERLVSAAMLSDGTLLRPTLAVQLASSNYFSTVGQDVLVGRSFVRSDDRSAPQVAIISKAMADRYWPGRSPLGIEIQLPLQASVPTQSPNGTVTIVGVVSDARRRLDIPSVEEIYRPISQDSPIQAHIVVRSSLERTELLTRVRKAIYALDPKQPIDSVQSFDEARHASLSPTKSTATLLSLFALIALSISALGIGGVAAFSVKQRTSEFGVLMALGAQRRDVLTMVLREALVVASLGLALGVAMAALFTQSIRGLLFGVDEHDPLTMIVVGVVLLGVTVGACVLPARRAASVDPMRALRCV
jgi:putative ABC transport system permease protein